MPSSQTSHEAVMSSCRMHEGDTEADQLRRQNAELRNRLTKLSEATLRITENLDFDAVLQEVIDSARTLTGARYGALLTYDQAGGIQDFITSGLTPEEIELLTISPKGLGLLGYLNDVREPLRVSDIASHPGSVGFPENHPPMKTFLGMPVRHHGEHVGNIYLTEKDGGREFTSEDEETLVMFASQAAHAISNGRRHEEALVAKADLEALVNISPVGVAVFDARTGELALVNQEARRIIGDVGSQDMPWEQVLELLTFQRADGRELSLSDDPMMRVLRSGETVRAEEIIINLPDGRSVPTLVNAAPIYSEQGEIVSVVVTTQDMTPLEEVGRLRAEFLGMVSQELRTPLTTIKGSVAALSGAMSSSNARESVQLVRIVDQQADLMRAQINSLIELTHIQAGTLSISPETVDVLPLVDTAIREFQRGQPGNPVEKNIPPGLSQIMADGQRIVQVLYNLMSHASKYSPQSSTIAVSAVNDDLYVAVSVSAIRIGMAAPESSRLFRKFSRIRPGDPTEMTGGDDLALAICRGIVEAHGGRMWADSGESGRGIVLTFEILVSEEVTENAAPGSAQEHDPSEVASGQSPQILVAVDDTRTLGVVRRILSRADYAPVVAAGSGEVDRLMWEEKPQLLLLDMADLGNDSFDVIRNVSGTYDVPVIVMSEPGDGDKIVRAYEMGADGYIVKPFSPTELVARIRASLRNRPGSRRSQKPEGYSLGGMAINYEGRVVTVGGHQVQMTATEYNLLFELSTKAGRVLTQDELLQRVWGPEFLGQPEVLRSYVRSLRRKLGDNARNPSYIFTEHGIGYRMTQPQPQPTP